MNNKKWFDKSLCSLKSHVLYLSRLLQKYPHDPEVRGSYYKTIKFYNKERKREKGKLNKKYLINWMV